MRPYEISNDGRSLHASGIYYTYTGDDELPICVAKIIETKDDQLCVKLFRDKYPDTKNARLSGDHVMLHMSRDMFLAWGPPDLPVLIHDEAITAEELSECDIERPPFPTDKRIDL